MIRVVETEERGCGDRVEHGVYLVSEGGKNGTLPLWTSILDLPEVPAFFRGAKSINGDALLEGFPASYWSATADTRSESLLADLFGMPFKKRRLIGNCLGATSEEQAIQLLEAAFNPNKPAVEAAIRYFTTSHLGESYPATVARVVKSMQIVYGYGGQLQNSELLSLVAEIWKLRDDAMVTLHRRAFAKFLSALGLYMDGLDYEK